MTRARGALAGTLLVACLAGPLRAWVTPQPSPKPGATAAERTEAVVRQTCAGCHALPSPTSLPKRAWQSVVLDMTGLIVQGIGLPPGALPQSTDFDPDQIIHYYETQAPQSLPSPPPWPAAEPAITERFTRHTLNSAAAQAPAAVANVRFLQLDRARGVDLVALDMLAGHVLRGDPRRPKDDLKLLAKLSNPCHAEPVDLDRDGQIDLLVADLGVPMPADVPRGSVNWLRHKPDGSFDILPLATGLPRVADVQAGDFDGDGDLDLAVAAFGWRRTGGVLLFENRTTDWSRPQFVQRVIDARAGAIHVPVLDLDKDGKLDIVALISQQHETVVAYLGDGKGGFRTQTIDQAPHPGWGSSGLQMVDMDGDGDQDVLVSNGDMLDDFQLKPYHGLRWLENRGSFPFTPHDIAPMFCVMRAQAADLDGDGDQDVVAGALVQFKPEEGGPPISSPNLPSLVWLEQTAPGVFARHTLETGGQHLSLDLGDYDGDGDIDIAAANSLSGKPGFVELWENRGRPAVSTPAP